MKRSLLFVCLQLVVCWLIVNTSIAQKPFDGGNYANHWIKTNKQYVRLSVVEKGVQSVTLNQLKSLGIVIDQFKNVQVFHRGKQVSIISLTPNELLFYGEPNDGASDSLLYRPMASRLNKYSSLYSNKGAYFICLNNDTETKLVEKVNEAVTGVPEPYHLNTEVVSFREEYAQSTQWFIPVPFQSYFENQECWTGKAIRSNGHKLYNFELKNRYSDNSIKPVLEVFVNGRQNNIKHDLSVSVGSDSTKLTDIAAISMTGITAAIARGDFANELLGSDGKGYIRVKSNIVNSQEVNSVAYYKLTYAQQFIMPNIGNGYFNLISKPQSEWRRVKIKNSKAESRVFDITDIDNPKEIAATFSNGELDLMVQCPANRSVTLFVSNTRINVEQVVLAPMKDIVPGQYNFLIVTNKNLSDIVNSQYKAYRESIEGGAYKVLVVNIDDIYNQFNYGEISPVGIRRFVDFMLSDGDKNKFLLLIGTSSSFPERSVIDLPGEVPTVGYPGSDVLLVDGLAGASTNVLAIPVGRIPAKTPTEVTTYLNKVKAYEKDGDDVGWKKRIMHMSGGKTTAELSQLKNALSSLVSVAESGYRGAKVQAIVKNTTEPVESVNITNQVNEGLGMITYFGHGSPIVTDLNMGYISAPERGYSNFEKYPFMYFNGCGVGNIFSGGDYTTLSTDWLLTPEKGAIAIMANSYFSYYSPTYNYLQFLYQAMFQDTASASSTVGQLMVKVSKNVVASRPNVFDVANIHQSVLQGDPAVRVMQVSKPDFALDKKQSVFLRSKNLLTKIGGNDSLFVGVAMTNKGRYRAGEKFTLQLDRYYNGSQTVTNRKEISTFAYQDTAYISIPRSATLSGVKVTLDPDNRIEELDESNNDATLHISWEIAKEEIVYWGENIVDKVSPRLSVAFDNRSIRNNDVVSSRPVISVVIDDDNLLAKDTSTVDVLLRPCQVDGECGFVRIAYDSGKLQMLSVDGKSLNVIFTPDRLAPGEYELFVNARDLSGNTVAQPYRIGFRVTDKITALSVINSPNPASGYVRFEASVNNVEVKSIHYQIVDSRGVIVHEEEVPQVRQGINEWYWYPSGATGNYFYKVISRTDNSEETAAGKIIVVR